MNVVDLISTQTAKHPFKRAVVFPVRNIFSKNVSYAHYTFDQYEQKINQFSNAFTELGVEQGDRVLVFVKPSLDFSALVFSLMKMGAVPVMIDPGMGKENLLKSIKEIKAKVLVGIPLIHCLRQIYKESFLSIQIFISTGFALPFTKTKSLARIFKRQKCEFPSIQLTQSDHAAILFTSGGTGTPKGVVYTHDIFINQTQMLQNEFELTDHDIDIPGFPLFALFTLSMGMTSCIPELNPSHPAKVKPERMVTNIIDQGATFLAGSPAIWKRVADYCLQNNIKLPSVKYLVMFGAPVPVSLHEKLALILPNGTSYTPYGATECLPISNISGRAILENLKDKINSGAGVCIGHALAGVELKIIKPNSGVIDTLDTIEELPPYEVGEILVSSPTVTKSYFARPEHTMLTKILGDNQVWHRMGDVGYLDADKKLWFCGRLAHVVNETYYPIPVEAIFNQHPEVARSALIALKKGHTIEPAIVIERVDKKVKLKTDKFNEFIAECFEIASQHAHTKDIHHIFLHENFPVDVRHNIKIDRIALSVWASSL
jgi:acyl-CoA synthetase (AMP-forming)/AMP-acid ligase II